MKYSIVIEKAGRKSFNVWSPDIPRCYAAGTTVEESVAFFRQAVEQYLKDLREMGLKPPKPVSIVDTIDVTGVV